MKAKRARALGFSFGSSKKSPEEVQRRLDQRATVIPDKVKEADRRACRDRRNWEK